VRIQPDDENAGTILPLQINVNSLERGQSNNNAIARISNPIGKSIYTIGFPVFSKLLNHDIFEFWPRVE
jgi:hypothetical protein